MSMIGSALGWAKARRAEEPSRPMALDEPAGWAWSGRYGRPIGADTALTQATTFACVSLIAESVGMLPFILYRQIYPGKVRAKNHPLYSVLHERPNPELTAQELYENIAGHLALWGNAYCEIEYDGAGRRRALWLLRPDHMAVGFENGERVYEYSLPNGETVRLERWRVWHVRGWGTEAWTGVNRLALAGSTIELALAEQEFGGRFFGNDSRPGGVLKTAGKLSEQAATRLKKSWEESHRGLSHAHRVAVLEEGVEWQAIGIEPERAQFLESRAFQQTEICGMFRVPPHMIGIVDKSTSWGTGIGQQTQGFVTYCLGPYLRRIALTAGRDLLTANEQREYFAEHLSDALVVNDLAARNASWRAGRDGGWLSVNEIREAENRNPVAGGDTYLQPLNMAPVGTPADGAAEDGIDGTPGE